MIALIIGILVSFIVTIVGTPLLIRLVHRLHYGQYIRQDGPQSHQVKRGTPTLGGVVINLAILLGWLASATYRYCRSGETPSPSAVLVLFAMLSMGLLGFIDDFAKVRKKAERGPDRSRQIHRAVHSRHHLRGAVFDDPDQIRFRQCAGGHQLRGKAVHQFRIRRVG